jgi:hypothetical protein
MVPESVSSSAPVLKKKKKVINLLTISCITLKYRLHRRHTGRSLSQSDFNIRISEGSAPTKVVEKEASKPGTRTVRRLCASETRQRHSKPMHRQAASSETPLTQKFSIVKKRGFASSISLYGTSPAS